MFRIYQSGTYELWDYLIYDGGVTGDKSSDWVFNADDIDNAKVETDDTGTTISATGAGKIPRYINQIKISGDFELTFEAKQEAGVRWGFSTNKWTASNVIMFQNTNAWLYYKVTRINGEFTVTYSPNGSTWYTMGSFTNSTDDYYFGFFIQLVSQSTRSVTYKNFKMVRI